MPAVFVSQAPTAFAFRTHTGAAFPNPIVSAFQFRADVVFKVSEDVVVPFPFQVPALVASPSPVLFASVFQVPTLVGVVFQFRGASGVHIPAVFVFLIQAAFAFLTPVDAVSLTRVVSAAQVHVDARAPIVSASPTPIDVVFIIPSSFAVQFPGVAASPVQVAFVALVPSACAFRAPFAFPVPRVFASRAKVLSASSALVLFGVDIQVLFVFRVQKASFALILLLVFALRTIFRVAPPTNIPSGHAPGEWLPAELRRLVLSQLIVVAFPLPLTSADVPLTRLILFGVAAHTRISFLLQALVLGQVLELFICPFEARLFSMLICQLLALQVVQVTSWYEVMLAPLIFQVLHEFGPRLLAVSSPSDEVAARLSTSWLRLLPDETRFGTVRCQE